MIEKCRFPGIRIAYQSYIFQRTFREIIKKKREEKGLLHGLYGFDETEPENIIKEIRLNPYSHIFSHVTWKMDAKVVYVDSCVDTCFYTLDQIAEKYAIPSAFKPFLDEIIDRKLVKYKP